MVEEGMKELKERKNVLQIDIEKLERRRERISREMRTNFAGVSQDLAVRVQGFKEYLVCDVSDEEQVIEAVARTVESMGQVDALIANAGRGGYGTPFLELGLDEWRTVMSVNLDGLFLCLREGAKQMVAQGTGGSLVGVSSTSAIHGAAGNEAYGASKTAVLGLVRALAVGMARHQIRVNALVPGWVTTEMTAGAKDRPKFMEATTKRTPVRRWGEPADFEEVGAFLADPSISYHTGQEVVVDGGYTVF